MAGAALRNGRSARPRCVCAPRRRRFASSARLLERNLSEARLARRRETINPLALLADCARPASRRLLRVEQQRHKNNECGLPPPRRKDQSQTYALRGAAERWLPASAARTTLKLASRFSAAPSPALRLSSPWQLARVGNACAPSPARGHPRAAFGRRRAAQPPRGKQGKPKSRDDGACNKRRLERPADARHLGAARPRPEAALP